MRLFSPQEVKERKQTAQIQEVQRGAKIASLVDAEAKKLETLQTTYEAQRKSVEIEFQALFDSLNEKRNNLESEVSTLQKKREEALKPVEDLKKVLQAQKKSFDELQKTFEKQETNLGNKAFRLSVQEEELESLKKKMASERERFDYKLIEVKAQENVVLDGFASLQKEWKSFISSTEESASLISDWEKDLKTQEGAYEVLRNEIETEKKNIELNKIKLLDLQKTIKSAFEEARQKNLI